MAFTYNQVILLGNVGKDPEFVQLDNGNQVATLSLATTSSYKDKNGEWIDNTDWHIIRAGIASAMAMSAIPTISNKRYSVGAGTATFRGESAVAIGLRVKSDKDNAVVSFSASASSNGDIAGAAGFAFGF